MSYNGWSNYETWNVALWIGNEQSTESSQMAQDAYDNATADGSFTRIERAAIDLSDSLKSWIEDMNPLAGESSMFADLLGAAISEVDWHEFAMNLLEDVDKDEEEADEDAEESEAETEDAK